VNRATHTPEGEPVRIWALQNVRILEVWGRRPRCFCSVHGQRVADNTIRLIVAQPCAQGPAEKLATSVASHVRLISLGVVYTYAAHVHKGERARCSATDYFRKRGAMNEGKRGGGKRTFMEVPCVWALVVSGKTH